MKQLFEQYGHLILAVITGLLVLTILFAPANKDGLHLYGSLSGQTGKMAEDMVKDEQKGFKKDDTIKEFKNEMIPKIMYVNEVIPIKSDKKDSDGNDLLIGPHDAKGIYTKQTYRINDIFPSVNVSGDTNFLDTSDAEIKKDSRSRLWTSIKSIDYIVNEYSSNNIKRLAINWEMISDDSYDGDLVSLDKAVGCELVKYHNHMSKDYVKGSAADNDNYVCFNTEEIIL